MLRRLITVARQRGRSGKSASTCLSVGPLGQFPLPSGNDNNIATWPYSTYSQIRGLAEAATARPDQPDTQPHDALPEHQNGVAKSYESLGLSAGLARTLTSTFSMITTPTEAQEELIPAVLSPKDVLLRAQTGSGKSFGLLLALMAKPRIVFSGAKDPKQAQHGIASIVVVPSNELAEQYVQWVDSLLPQAMQKSRHLIIQKLVRADADSTPEQQVERLAHKPPHILVATPTRALEVLGQPGGSALLGLSTLRTLALDEVDALLDLPGRYPTKKVVWKNLKHPPAGLRFLNEVMRLRGTHSSGQPLLSQGQEARRPQGATQGQVVRERYRQRSVLERSPNHRWLAVPRDTQQGSGNAPLQLVACSASANSVLRSFFGHVTGWVRIGAKAPKPKMAPGSRKPRVPYNNNELASWIDLSGLTQAFSLRQSQSQHVEGKASASTSTGLMPRELIHSCVIVDESEAQEGEPRSMRNLSPTRLRRAAVADQGSSESEQGAEEAEGMDEEPDGKTGPDGRRAHTVVPWSASANETDMVLLESLAFIYAMEGVQRGIAFIPPRWSLRTVQSELAGYGIPVVDFSQIRNPSNSSEDAEPMLAVIQATSARGLDIPDLSHVFIVGNEAVGDSVQYTHLAGRASRFSVERERGSVSRPPGKVVTFLRGLTKMDRKKNDKLDAQWEKAAQADPSHRPPRPPPYVASSERRMLDIYRKLGINVKKVGQLRGGMAEPEEDDESANTEDVAREEYQA